MNEETKVYIDSKFNEVNQKIDNLLSLFEKIRNNEIRTLMYSQLTARQLNYFFYVDQIRNQDSARSFPYYEKVANTDKCRRAHALTEICAQDLKDLVVKKSKGRKDLIEDDFTNSLAFIGGIDDTLL